MESRFFQTSYLISLHNSQLSDKPLDGWIASECTDDKERKTNPDSKRERERWMRIREKREYNKQEAAGEQDLNLSIIQQFRSKLFSVNLHANFLMDLQSAAVISRTKQVNNQVTPTLSQNICRTAYT